VAAGHDRAFCNLAYSLSGKGDCPFAEEGQSPFPDRLFSKRMNRGSF
jgi:hypothetical protein